ncbi:hypothetical protein ACO2TQ_40220 [Burkholderia sp. OKR4-1]|uniref:hypothetical protein n=1 Tax=Burkholderia TaxID=32008 RepID=UPI001FA6AC61|nr:hypothetical protein [Burkholderia contaminans]MDK1000895.1 hypothetical protein [Burkholderia contaminans]
MTHDSGSDASKAASLLSARLDAMISGQLKVPVTDGPFFVLLAMASCHADMVRPVLDDCDSAATVLQRAEPNGYVLTKCAKRNGRTLPPRTYVSDFPDGPVRSFAYVDVSERGIVEYVAGAVADKTRRLVGLGGIEHSIEKNDAQVLRDAFNALGVGSHIVVMAALLGTQGAFVTWRGPASEKTGELNAPYVKIPPLPFAAPAALKATDLNWLVRDLWDKVTEQAR